MRRSHGIRLALALLLTGLLLGSSGTARAECIGDNTTGGEGTGTGGTGFRVAGESGTGGTGVRGDEGSGTGGTGTRGDEGSGTGGTGILGTITGFGSVCVNGLRVEYDDATEVMQGDHKTGAGQLAVGQVVRVTTAPGAPLRARRIAIENALSGPVTRVDAAANRMWVMDQPVALRPGTRVVDRANGRETELGGLGAGARVDVSGQRRSDGVVVATRIATRDDDRPDSVTGPTIAIAGETVYVGDLRSTLASGEARLSDGVRATLQGRWDESTRTLRNASMLDASPAAGGARRLSIQGFVAPPYRGGDLELSGVPVDLSGLPPRERELARDALVEIRGSVNEKGWLRAERVHVERAPHPREGAVAPDDTLGRKSESERGDRSGRSEREDRSDRSGSDRSDRPERSGRPERPERNDRPDRSGPD